jgi:polyhydroxyalkanoate synthesis regulator phasin
VDWKEQLRNKALTLLANPRVSAILQDPRVTQGIVSAFKLRSNVEKRVEEGARQIAKRLHLASESEVQELRRAVARLERQLEQARLEDAEIVADSRALS